MSKGGTGSTADGGSGMAEQTEDAQARSAPPRRPWVAITVVGVVLGLSGVAVWWWLSDDSGSRRSSSSQSPEQTEGSAFPEVEPDRADATRRYLAGEGALLIAVHRQAGSLVNQPDAQRCRSVVDRLNRDAPVAQVHEQLVAVADPVVREGVLREVDLLGRVAATCNAIDGDLLTSLEEATDALEERLAELETTS